jgi:hypothetical protein
MSIAEKKSFIGLKPEEPILWVWSPGSAEKKNNKKYLMPFGQLTF